MPRPSRHGVTGSGRDRDGRVGRDRHGITRCIGVHQRPVSPRRIGHPKLVLAEDRRDIHRIGDRDHLGGIGSNHITLPALEPESGIRDGGQRLTSPRGDPSRIPEDLPLARHIDHHLILLLPSPVDLGVLLDREERHQISDSRGGCIPCSRPSRTELAHPGTRGNRTRDT